jgi:hypothetical protein
MRTFVSVAAVVLMATTAVAQTDWYARGDWNGWDLSDPMDFQGGDYYTKTITELTTGTGYEYKIATADWSLYAPGSNGKVPGDASGEINFHFWDNESWADGWEPSAKRRVGYEDHGLFDWEIVGDMNDWGLSPDLYLTDQGGGLHTGQFTLDAGTYAWKFRQQEDWAYSIGDDFGNSAADNSITVDNNGDLWAFELDLPNGRWRAYYVPEPTSLVLIGLGALMVLRRR